MESSESVAIGKKALQYSNEFRKTEGKPPLVWSQALHNICLYHSKVMAGKEKISHDDFDKRIDEMKLTGISYCGAAENVAMNWEKKDPARKAVDQWIKSTGHRANLLSEQKICAVSCQTAPNGGQYYCQMFWNTNNDGMETNKKLNAEAGGDAEAVAPGSTAAA